MQKSLFLLSILLIFLAGCGGGDEENDNANQNTSPTTNVTTAPTNDPNLRAELSVNGKTSLRPPNCLGTHSVGGTQVFIWNSSEADIFGEFLVEVDGVQQTIQDLAAGEVKDIFFEAGTTPGSQYRIIVDPDNRVPETDENNNSFVGTVLTLTPPPPCTPTPQS